MKDGDGSRKSPSVAMGIEPTEPGATVDVVSDGIRFLREKAKLEGQPQRVLDDIEIMAKGSAVIVDRKLLEEALAHIVDTDVIYIYADKYTCRSCRADSRALSELEHTPDCRYVRVRDALKGLVGE